MFDSEDDEPAGRQPLPPEDRLWRHPSELGAARPAPPAPPSRRANSFAVAAGSALAGAMIVGGAWLAVSVAGPGSQDGTQQQREVDPVASAPPRDDTWTEPIALALEPSLPTIKAMADGASTTAAGVVLDADGHIVTSAGVVGDADLILVFGPNGRRSTAEVVAVDGVTDLAVVHTVRSDLEVATFSLTRRTRVGQYALACGPAGTVSPDGRVVALSTSVAGPNGLMLHGVIAFSSPANPPTPGAGVFDDTGEVFAITTSARAVSADRMGHAIPSTLAVDIARQLISDGQALHPWLGIQGTDLPPDKAAALGTSGGASVTAVTADGPAEAAGLLVGDTVLAANGQSVDSMAGLVMILRNTPAGEVLNLQVVRSGSLLTLSAELDYR